MKKKRVGLAIVFTVFFVVVAIVLTGFLYSQRLSAESFSLSADIPAEIKICQLSDMHFPYLGVKSEKILAACEKFAPDVIVVTGDAYDGKANNEDLKELGNFYFELRKLAPVYAVLGNHEIGSEILENYKTLCADNGVKLLINETDLITLNGVRVMITGLNDGNNFSEKNLPLFSKIKELNAPDISLLLAHRPEKLTNYAEGQFTAAFTGHAHGGQARIFGKGVYAPDQGAFPLYTSGEYESGVTKMFVSRGLGDSVNGFRFFNPYNINFITVSNTQ